jgi:hypothetical protein
VATLPYLKIAREIASGFYSAPLQFHGVAPNRKQSARLPTKPIFMLGFINIWTIAGSVIQTIFNFQLDIDLMRFLVIGVAECWDIFFT